MHIICELEKKQKDKGFQSVWWNNTPEADIRVGDEVRMVISGHLGSSPKTMSELRVGEPFKVEKGKVKTIAIMGLVWRYNCDTNEIVMVSVQPTSFKIEF